MNVLIAVSGKYPTPNAWSKRLSNYVKALQMENHNVEVMTVFISANSNFRKLLYSQFIPYLAFWRLFRRVRQHSLVLIYGFGWLGKLLIVIACKIRSIPVAVEINEKPYSIHGGSRRDYFLKFIEPFHEFCLTRVLYPLIDGFIVISENLANDLNRYRKLDATVCKVPILVDYEYYQHTTGMPDCNAPYLLHSASFNNNKDGMINVLKAFAIVVNEEHKDLYLYMTSDIAPIKIKKQMKEILREGKLENRVAFLGDLDEQTLLAYQQHCCMLVLNKVNSEQNRYNFATKLGEYLAIGIPVITTPIGEVTNYLKGGISCLYVNPEDPSEIADSIIQLLNDDEFAAKIALEGKSIARNEFDYRAQSHRLNHFFGSLINKISK